MIRVIVEGDKACFTRPELKTERVSYDVATPGAMEGMLKSVYWKPAIRYVVDRIVVFNPIEFVCIRINEAKEKVSSNKVIKQMAGEDADPCIYTSECRHQRESLVLTNVKYGVEFHIEMTGLRCDEPGEGVGKHTKILKRRLKHGQYFRKPYLGIEDFEVRKIELVEAFDESQIDSRIREMEDVDLGYMSCKVEFKDKGIPINGDWDNPVFSDESSTFYFRPHMKKGIIDVAKYKGGARC